MPIPDDLHELAQPWYSNLLSVVAQIGLFGEIIPEEEFDGWLKIADAFSNVSLKQSFVDRIRDALARHLFVISDEIKKLGVECHLPARGRKRTPRWLYSAGTQQPK